MIFKKTFRTKKKKKKSKKVVNIPVAKVKERKIKKLIKKIFNWLTKNKDKIDVVKEFILIIVCYGILINYSIHFIFGIKFSLLTFPAWGIAYYFIKDEFVEWFRRLIAKR